MYLFINEDLHDLYSSLNTVRVIKSRMKWAEHVERMGNKRGVFRVLVGILEWKWPLGRPGVDGRELLGSIKRVEFLDYLKTG